MAEEAYQWAARNPRLPSRRHLSRPPITPSRAAGAATPVGAAATRSPAAGAASLRPVSRQRVAAVALIHRQACTLEAEATRPGEAEVTRPGEVGATRPVEVEATHRVEVEGILPVEVEATRARREDRSSHSQVSK